MKKILLLWTLICSLTIFWCGQRLWENESAYNWELTISWIGPEISMEPIVEEGTLVLKWSSEDHTDHIFFSKWIRENYLKEETDYLPWNILKFKWIVVSIDWAAGNHYYNVKTIDKLELVKYPNANKIKEIFDSYNYCESDSDCEYFGWECPLWCYILMNKKYISIAQNIVSNFSNNLGDERCVYDCIYMEKAVCKNYKCEMWTSDEEESIECSPEEKNAENCNMIYEPVCGSDSRTYWNSCVACQSETVESYTLWECESSAFTVEWATEYYDYVMDYFQEEWWVTCKFTYSFNWEELSWKLIADNENFYSIRDDYFEWNIDYGYTTLVTNNKTYNWIESSPRDWGTIFNFASEPDSEIASLLITLWEYPNFEIECDYWIYDKNIFNIPENIDFS